MFSIDTSFEYFDLQLFKSIEAKSADTGGKLFRHICHIHRAKRLRF